MLHHLQIWLYMVLFISQRLHLILLPHVLPTNILLVLFCKLK